jgi:OmpA-OmpF porin, OOP family
MRNIIFLCTFLFCIGFSSSVKSQNEDAEGCKDHPMFNRMPGFHINFCETKDFDAFSFPIENSTAENCKKQIVEGTFYSIGYTKDEGVKEESALQIFRNFENALKQINAKIVAKVVEPGNSYSFITGIVKKNDMETWLKVEATGTDYQLFIVEKQVMEQVIQANEMLQSLNKEGFISLNILFETGKSTIKPESIPIVEQIYEMLKNNPGLKVSLEGHTDDTGTPVSNKTLSEARAKAVMDVIITKGINKERLAAKGWGQEKPVADNRTEEGKAKNRRVEIVKQK